MAALDRALARGRPAIFNTDQGSPFIRLRRAFSGRLLAADVRLRRMDGRGRALDNVFVESASGGWRSVKYEEVYLNPPEADGSDRRLERLLLVLQRGAPA